MDVLNKFSERIKSRVVSDAVPSHPDVNGDVPASRIPTFNIEEVPEGEGSPEGEYSLGGDEDEPVVDDPTSDAPPVPPRRKKSKAKSQKSQENGEEKPEENKVPPSPPINTQASGNVINIVNSQGVHFGSSVTCNISSLGDLNMDEPENDPEAAVPKTKSIVAVMASKIKLEHEYMDILSRNMGSGWRKVCRKLGYTDPVLDTFYESHHHEGLPEIIYQILLDWSRTKKGTLGEMCTVVWKEGKRLAVSEVAKAYKLNMKNMDKFL